QQRTLVAGEQLHFCAEEAEHTRRRHIAAAKDVHRGRLARARRPHDGDEIAAFDRQTHAFQRLEGGHAFTEGLGYPLQFDDRLAIHSLPALIEVTTFMPVSSSSDVTTV